MATPIVSASIGGKNLSDATSFSLAITVPSGSNQIALVVGAITGAVGSPGALTSTPTFGGSNMTLIDYTLFGGAWTTFAYYIKLPAAGSRTFSCAWTNSGVFDGEIYIIDGVDQTASVRTITTGSTASLSSITCAIGDLLVDLANSTSDPAPTSPGAGQTAYRADNIAAGYGSTGTSTKTAGSASETMSWTIGATVRHIAIPIIPAPNTNSGLLAFFLEVS